MVTDTSGRGLERLLCTALAVHPGGPPEAARVAEPRTGHGGVGWMRIPAAVITHPGADVTGLRHRRHMHVGVETPDSSVRRHMHVGVETPDSLVRRHMHVGAEAPDSSVRRHMHVGAETPDSSVRRLPPTVRHILAP